MMEDNFFETLSDKIKSTSTTLEQIWFELSLERSQKAVRQKVLYDSLLRLCDNIVENEEKLKKNIFETADSLKKDIEDLCKELECKEEPFPNIPVLDLTELLKNRVTKLNELKKARLEVLEQLFEEEGELCQLLGEISFNISENKVPSENDLKELRQQIEFLKNEKASRTKTYQKLRDEILFFAEKIQKKFEDSLFFNVTCDEEPSILTMEYIEEVKRMKYMYEFEYNEKKTKHQYWEDKLKSIWNRLHISDDERAYVLEKAEFYSTESICILEKEYEKMKELRRKNLKKFIDELKCVLENNWVKCWVGTELKSEFKSVISDKVNEDTLEQYENEIKKWDNFYAENTIIFDTLTKFIEVLKNMQQLSNKMKDKTRLFNTRGGALLQEEKERNKVQQELPKLEARLRQCCYDYAEKNDKEILFNGLMVEDFISQLYLEHDLEKDRSAKMGLARTQSTHKVRRMLSSATKRNRDEDNLPTSSKKFHLAPPGLPKTPTRLIFKSPRTYKKTPTSLSVPRNRKPLQTCKSANIEMKKKLNKVDKIRESLTYENFKSDITSSKKNFMHSSIILNENVSPPTNTQRRTPSKDARRSARLQQTLNLATPRLSRKASISGGASKGALLRTLSQNSLHKTMKMTPKATKKPWLI